MEWIFWLWLMCLTAWVIGIQLKIRGMAASIDAMFRWLWRQAGETDDEH